MATKTAPWTTSRPTALIVLADGTVIEGKGMGAGGEAIGELCFNTALTGYQEVLTDPSYAGQIVTFTFPHIGNVGANDEDIEDLNPATRAGAVGAVLRADITNPSNYRSSGHLDAWLKRRGLVVISGVDTRALTALLREKGAANAVIAHNPDGTFDIEALRAKAREWSGLVGLDLAKEVTSGQSQGWTETPWVWDEASARRRRRPTTSSRSTMAQSATSCAFWPARCESDRGSRQNQRRRHPRHAARWRIPLQRPG